MGASNSKFSSGGALKGAYAPPLPNVVLPPKMDPRVREFMATVPSDKKGGDKMTLALDGRTITITIPLQKRFSDGSSRPMKRGDTFKFQYGHRERVIASTLPSLPGTTVVEAKPMIFANVSEAFSNGSQTSMSRRVGDLMQEAQTQLLQQGIEMGCNAVLSINSNISTDSSGDYYKIVIVTLVGTPCVVMRSEDLPVVQSEAVVVPDYIL